MDWFKFNSACEDGNKELVELMISKGVHNWNQGLCGACLGGHLDIVELLIKKGADDWNNGLYYACKGGHIDVVELMLSKDVCNINGGFISAFYGKHYELSLIMITKGADISQVDFNSRDYDLEYLIKANFQSFGKYSNNVIKVRKYLTEYYSIIYNKVIPDMSKLIMEY
jgi:ankyrin repeat protein